MQTHVILTLLRGPQVHTYHAVPAHAVLPMDPGKLEDLHAGAEFVLEDALLQSLLNISLFWRLGGCLQ